MKLAAGFKFGVVGMLLTAIFLLNHTACAADDNSPLVWDSVAKQYNAKTGDTNAVFFFTVTNVSPAEVVINSVRTSCGCTVAKVPTLPWKLAAGSDGQMEVIVDLRGKHGTIIKTVTVDSSAGTKFLQVTVAIPEMDPREKNRMLASADRQAVFRNDCASCHVTPTHGKKGEALFAAACGICHEAEHRASMVPDLKNLGKPTDAEYWTAWVVQGKQGTLMPAFAKTQGGPLDGEQIQSLVEYLTQHFPSKAASTTKTSASAAGH